MLSLSLGLLAALLWGIHDVCVRYISQNGDILPALASVMIAGCIFQAPVILWFGHWQLMTSQAYTLSAVSGLCFAFGCIGLYNAFSIGPVRLVAPIMGSYPALSIAWAAVSGQAVPWDQWMAVGLVILGVAIVSTLSEHEHGQGDRKAAIGWAIMGAIGFALTFAVGQAATQSGDELPVVLITRLVTATCIFALLMLRTGLQIPQRSAWPMLALMGFLDATALGIVIAAGGLERPEFAAVAASIFGIITIILAWAFLKERMTAGQWLGVVTTFVGIGYLAF